MKWIVEGANPETCTELTREVEAANADEAETIAMQRGLLVASVKPSPANVVPHEPSPHSLHVKQIATMIGPVIICPNPNCGFRGPCVRQKRGYELLGFLLILCGLVPGILYFALCYGNKDACSNCGNQVKTA